MSVMDINHAMETTGKYIVRNLIFNTAIIIKVLLLKITVNKTTSTTTTTDSSIHCQFFYLNGQ